MSEKHIISNQKVSVDVSMLYEVCGTDTAQINLMVHTFIKSVDDTLTKIDDSLAAANWQNVYQAAHHAKSSLSIVGVDDMLEWIKTLEYNAKHAQNLSEVPALFARIRNKFTEARQVLLQKFA